MNNKTCTGCGESKPVTDYSRDASKRSGFRRQCKVCTCAKGREYKKLNADILRSKNHEYYKKNIDSHSTRSREYYKANSTEINAKKTARYLECPEKTRAGHAVGHAVQTGKIERSSECNRCGSTRNIQGHHWSYLEEHWLDVEWLCAVCHMRHHRSKGTHDTSIQEELR